VPRNGILCLAIVLAANHPSGAQGTDLRTVDRQVRREPNYRDGSPKYCLLVFGPKAEARVWLVRVGDLLYVDRNGNGDLTEDGERVARFLPKPGEANNIPENCVMFRTGPLAPSPREPSRRYPDLLVMFIPGQPEQLLMLLESQDWPQAVGCGERMQFGASPGDAPIVHFDGPLTLATVESLDAVVTPLKLIRGRDTVLSVAVGTHGLGPGTFACRPYRRLTVASFLNCADEKQLGEAAPEELKVLVELHSQGADRALAPSIVLEGRC
jgi:hypothetical protein